jgi:hypothetical protein
MSSQTVLARKRRSVTLTLDASSGRESRSPGRCFRFRAAPFPRPVHLQRRRNVLETLSLLQSIRPDLAGLSFRSQRRRFLHRQKSPSLDLPFLDCRQSSESGQTDPLKPGWFGSSIFSRRRAVTARASIRGAEPPPGIPLASRRVESCDGPKGRDRLIRLRARPPGPACRTIDSEPAQARDGRTPLSKAASVRLVRSSSA